MSFDLERFVSAQAPVYQTALSELRAGHKRSHWMWFVFPQIEGLGKSPAAQKYALVSLGEARAYWAHATLGPRLRECTQAVLTHKGLSAHAIFGAPDDMKFHSSMTLFARAAPDAPEFGAALATFFNGEADQKTLERL